LTPDTRYTALTHWLSATLPAQPFEVTRASDDASFRRYFRVRQNGSSWVAMDAPPDKEALQPFILVAEALVSFGLNVPQIHARDTAQGFLLLDDFGDQLYLAALNPDSAERLYGDAIAALVTLQASGQPASALPPYDTALLQRELALFSDWYLARHLNLALTPQMQETLSTSYAVLVANALAQPQVWVHRDYHSRNLMVTAKHNPGILDFQDAVLGPVTYDLVSLLRDCYIAWPRAQVEAWALGYCELAIQAGVLHKTHEAQFLRWFDLMGVQRHLKATGIFARLNYRDHKPRYLNDVPRTLGYVREVCGRYPELAAFGELLAAHVPG
jgi:aminoglycoside/choline kinase family phosphotransferase